MITKRKRGRPAKHDFRLKKGESRDFKFSESTRVCALQWGDRHGFLFSTEKNGEILTVTRLK